MDEEKILLNFVNSRKGVSWHDIKTYCESQGTDSQRISDTYFDEHGPEKSLFMRSRGLWVLTPEGKRRLEEKYFWNRNNKFFIANIILTLVVGIIVAFYSTGYANNLAVSLEEKYNSPLKLTPQTLNITMDKNFKEIPAQQLIEKDNPTNRPKVEICIKNFAKMKTDHIHFILIDNNLTSTDGNIENIDSVNSKCDYVSLRHRYCYSDSCPIDINSIPNGIVPLTFEFNCKNCEPQIFNYTFDDICIWRESSLECKN